MIPSNQDAETRHIVPFSLQLVRNDADAHDRNPTLRHIYNKKWVTESQGNPTGTMKDIPQSFPVFAKPIVNLKGANKDCYVIKDKSEFLAHSHRDDMFWATEYQGQEGSTDFLIDHGRILFEQSYTIDKEPGTIAAIMTTISPYTKAPETIRHWVRTHLRGYSGPCNVQYIGDNIIEVGLRFDSGGNFLQWTNHAPIIHNINHFIETNQWSPMTSQHLTYKPRYIVGCYQSYPIIYYLPAPIVIAILRYYNVENYNFYVDLDKKGLKYLNIVDPNREKLARAKHTIEEMMNIANSFFLVAFSLLGLAILHYCTSNSPRITSRQITILSVILFTLYSTRFINPPKYLRKML